FAPQEERSYNYNVVCKVANKPTRLTLNVKGEGYALHDALVLEGAEGLSTPLAANAVNPLDFGQVIVNERSVRSLALVNTGSLAYDFVWDLGSNPRLSVKPLTGTVGKGERVPVELAYHPHGPDKLRDYTVTCQVHVRLDDGTPAPTYITAVPVPVAVELKPKTPPGKPGKAIAEQGPVNKILTEGVVFERLLLGRKDSKTFIITNPGLLPIKWRLTGVEGLPKELVVSPVSASKRLALENTGDVGTKYSWDNKGLGPHFTIAPEEGFLAPGQTVRLDVTFRPQAVSPDIRVERVRCTVEGGSNLALTLTGACVTTVPQAEPVNFACAVRSSTTQTVNLSNPSSSPWQLRPVLSNDFFSGPEYVDVSAYSKAAYVITYRPLTMSSPDQPHEGSVFFPIPDGTGLLHRLVGRAEAPVPEGRIEKSITAKQQHTELLRVSNWLSRQQRFKVTIQRKAVDKATVLEGPEYIDVPAHSSKDYKLSVYSYTASVSQAVVTFKNESSGEYTFYELKLSASPAARQGELVLECPCVSMFFLESQ
ncbi:uncharacterized protein HaLaN_23467, partial [Haematococcus lacustris]